MNEPFLDRRELPESEFELAGHIQAKLRDLSCCIVSFEHALALFEESQTKAREKIKAAGDIQFFPFDMTVRTRMVDKDTLFNRASRLQAWAFIAARDAAFQVYHFRATLCSIISNVQSPKKLRR
ncbi:hypothetical protein [Bradyrhizobium sp.]|uniref:hypothetical protein n=1 Tax=Bradyrhizobium sp. TaxID=376 RepID=UPI002DF9D1FE|nr:hypothetical protein [Bradyrhizobium sp.]